MQKVFINLFQSKTRLMVVLRYLLFGTIVLMAGERLKIILSYIQDPIALNNRDVFAYYLIAGAVKAGINPYLPLNKLANILVGPVSFFPHPAPWTPFLTILFLPLTSLRLNQWSGVIFGFEFILLLGMAILLTILWKSRMDWVFSVMILVILFAWYPVAVDFSYGQISIFLAVLILASLLSYQRNHSILAGGLIGITVAVKLITWPVMIYFALKKDWRALISSSLTVIGLNLLALLVIGPAPFVQYYLQVSRQVLPVYQAVMHNFSLWSIGFRLFAGTGSTTFPNFINAPAMIDKPGLAPIASGFLVVMSVIIFAWYAFRIKDTKLSFSLIICAVLLVSPITWAHYFVMLIIPLSILYQSLQQRSYPAWQTLVFTTICLLLFLFNEQIERLVILMNGGNDYLSTVGNRITFASSLLSFLPIIEIVAVCILLIRSGKPVKITPCNASSTIS